MCTSGAAIAKAGAGANATIVADTNNLELWSNQVESRVSAITRVDWVANPPSTQASGALAELSSDLIAMKIITYDMSGYIGTEAQTMLDVLRDNSNKGMKELQDKIVQEKM